METDARASGLERRVERAAAAIAGGGVVAFPTETFYGLAVDPRRDDAIARLLEIKGRDEDGKPILLLIAALDDLQPWVARLPGSFDRLVAHFWPGPLTLVVPARDGLHPSLVGGQGGVALRLTAHPLAAALIRCCGHALTGTSANRAGEAPPVDAEQVTASLGDLVEEILDGGRTAGGLPSTVLDLTGRDARLVRRGAVETDAIERLVRLV